MKIVRKEVQLFNFRRSLELDKQQVELLGSA
jgi:hypothetical protein